MKTCSRCKEQRDESLFYREESRPDKLAKYCIECQLRVCKETARRIREEALLKYGGAKCANCGEDFFEALALDHIDGGGKEDREQRGAGATFLRALRREGWPSGFQVLCHNCNAIKSSYPELLEEYKKRKQSK